jgi:uncharacterized membrane-anchored protein YitT (DUF2179 family)
MKQVRRNIAEFLQIGLGIVLASIGLKAFLLPNGFLDGGVTGIAILLEGLIGWHMPLWLLIASIPFLILGLYTLPKRIVIKSSIAILALAIFISFENFEAVTDDKLLIAIFGGLFLGAGIGLTIKNGAVLDGSEILGIYVHDRYGFSIGRVILIFNVILFAITAAFISMETAMYSVLTYLVTSKVVDLMIEGFEDYIGLMVVSKEFKKIETRIGNELGTGITVYKGVRGSGSHGVQDNVDIIHLVINRIDMRRAYNLILEEDDQAFIIEFDVNNVIGGHLRKNLFQKKKPLAKQSNEP